MKATWIRAGALSYIVFSGPAMAQNVSRDPFSMPPATERIEVAQRERIERITQEILTAAVSEFEQRVTEVIDQRIRESVEVMLKKAIDEMEAKQSTQISEMIDTVERLKLGGGDTIVNELPVVPDDFVACVNGRPLYRDQRGQTFYAEEGGAKC